MINLRIEMKITNFTLRSVAAATVLACTVGCPPPADRGSTNTSTDTTPVVDPTAGSNTTGSVETPTGNVTGSAETPAGSVTKTETP